MQLTLWEDYLSGRGLQAKLGGKYQEACNLFGLAYDCEVRTRGFQRPCFLVDVLLNWADAQRRLSQQPEDVHIRYALDLFGMAFRILLDAPECEKQAIACLHHYGRLERQRGNFQEANRRIDFALHAVRSYVRRQPFKWHSPVVDRVMIPLDAVSIRALNGRSLSARLAVLEALAWCLHPTYWLHSQVNYSHIGRVMILLRYASNPFIGDSRVRRAFFGREVLME